MTAETLFKKIARMCGSRVVMDYRPGGVFTAKAMPSQSMISARTRDKVIASGRTSISLDEMDKLMAEASIAPVATGQGNTVVGALVALIDALHLQPPNTAVLPRRAK